MSTAVKSKLPKSRPLISKEAAAFIRKRRMGSQQTLDTLQTNKEEQQQCKQRLNQDELLRAIAQTHQLIDNYRPHLLKHKSENNDSHWLRIKDDLIQKMNKEILELQDEIGRLTQIYNRPKAFSPASQYTQLHLKEFTLADEVAKQRKHLQLHIGQHQKLKTKAEDLHRTIKALLPKYAEGTQKKGLKPMSYGDFRKKMIMQRKERELKSRMRSLSSRSSNRSRSTSIRSILSGNSEADLKPEQKNVYHMQRRKSIASRARISTRKRYQQERTQLESQLQFLRDENGNLNIKIDQLSQQLANLERNISESTVSASLSRRMSQQYL